VIFGSNPPAAGSYFTQQPNPLTQGSTTGIGIGATFNASWTEGDQRVILTNQEFACMTYIKRVIDPNVMDMQFIDAWQAILASRLAIALTGDKAMANMKVAEANSIIQIARVADGNEGLTINDVTPDWIRVRGYAEPDWGYSPNQAFDYGPLFEAYG
jgi:hypothetical protein